MSTGSKLAKVAAAAVGATAVVAARDLTQKKHAILRTYPVIGHLRFFLERFGPELRQYIVTSNDEERPFSRDQRRWIYSSAKLENNYFGFGTDNDVEHANGYPIIKHRTFQGEGAPTARHAGDEVHLPSAKVLGGPRGRRHAFRPASIVNISGDELRLAVRQRHRGAQPRGRDWPAACTTPARAPCRRTTATAATWSSRSARRTSGAATTAAPSTSAASRTSSPGRRSGPSRSSCRREPSPVSAACCPGRR